MTERITPEEQSYVIQRYTEGAALRQIGREIGRPDITVRRTLEAHGLYRETRPRGSNTPTTPETEEQVLRLYDGGATWKRITEQAGVSSRTIAKILTHAERELSRKPESTDGSVQLILDLYASGHSTRSIGAKLKISKSTVNGVLVRNGIEVRKAEGCKNPTFFQSVSSQEKAYWLGFISADGCIVATPRHPEGDHLAVSLNIRDRGHLAKLRDALGANASVRTGIQSGFGKQTGFATLAVGSRELTDDLVRLGVTPRKSTTMQPWEGPAHLMRHYWRGMVDGDGSLARKGENLYTVFLCGSEACVRGFAAWAAELCGTTAKPYTRTGCWYISISGRHQVRKLVQALYGDAAVSLDRKQEIANRILSTE